MKINAINSGSLIIDASTCIIMEADERGRELFGFSERTDCALYINSLNSDEPQYILSMGGRNLADICSAGSLEALSGLLYELYTGKKSYFATIATMKTFLNTNFISEINGCLLDEKRARLFFTEISDYSNFGVATDIAQSNNLEDKRNMLINSLYNAMAKQYDVSLIVNLSKDMYAIRNVTNELFEDLYEKGSFSELNLKTLISIHPADIQCYEPFLYKNPLNYFDGKGERITSEFRMKCLDGQYHWIMATLIRLYDINRNSTDVHAVYLVNIIDRQKFIERNVSDALLAAETANKAKSDFLARVSHDIRTPMNAIIGLTGIIRNSIDNKEKVLKDLNKLELSSKYLLSLINNILDMSRIESGKMIIERSRLDLEEFINGIKIIIMPQVKQKKQTLKIINNNPISRFFLGDELRLNQILLNLLSNAVKFTPESGSIIFEIEQKKHMDNWIKIAFTISDTGIGMSEELIKEAFKPFVQGENLKGSYEGSGLGLSIVHNLVQMMNGAINVFSRMGEGTKFVVEIPLEIGGRQNNMQIPHMVDSKKLSIINFKGKKLLLAEDDQINAEIALTILGDRGISVDVVSNGDEAVKKFDSSPEYFYDGILMDVQMPVMDGFEATEKIRALPRADASEIPIIAMTANAFLEDIASAKAHGMDAHVAKPIDVDMLFDTLGRLLM